MTLVSHLTTVHPPKDVRIYQRFSRGISDDVDHVNILHCGDSPSSDDANVNFVSVDRRRGRPGRMSISALKICYFALKKRSDVYHIHDPEIFILSFLLPSKSTVVVDFHENYAAKIDSRYWVPKVLRRFFLLLYYLVIRLLVLKGTKVIVAADSVLEGLPEKMRKQATVVRNLPAWKTTQEGVDLKQKESETPRMRGTLNILYTGGLTEYRGVENVIKAVFSHGAENWRLTIIGKTSETTKNKVKKYIDGKRIRHLGVVSYEESMRLNAHSDIGTVCNLPVHDYDKALPNKLFEYLSFKTAVVCSNFPIWSDIVLSNRVGEVCDPTSPKSIAEAIGRLEERIANDHAILERCAEVIEQQYNWEVEKAKLLRVYNVI